MSDPGNTDKSQKRKSLTNLLIAIGLCLSLGLAPFSPESHILGKIRWIIGGAVGMKFMDWFDFFLHLSPFIFLIVVIFKKTKS